MLPEEYPSNTKIALLDSAERLFAATGIAETSLRAITREADANLASVNYHFGSKEGLVRAVFARRLQPLNRTRLDLLENCLSHGEGGADLECVLRAFVEPAMAMMTSDDPGHREFTKLLGRMLLEPAHELRSLMIGEFEEIAQRFSGALQHVFPQAPREEIAWRFHFMVGALAHTVAARYVVSPHLECLEVPEDEDVESLTRRLVGFLAGGWSGMGEPVNDRRSED